MACRNPSVGGRDYHVVIEQLNVSPDLPRDEFEETLSLKPVSYLEDFRKRVFDGVIKEELADTRDVLVSRKNLASRPLHVKLAEDIWSLCDVLRNHNTDSQSFAKEWET